jgi:hypothetical protein
VTNYLCICGKDVNSPCKEGTAVTMADNWKIVNGKYIAVGKVWYLCGDCQHKKNKDFERATDGKEKARL